MHGADALRGKHTSGKRRLAVVMRRKIMCAITDSEFPALPGTSAIDQAGTSSTDQRRCYLRSKKAS
jgi:hypothetical protein